MDSQRQSLWSRITSRHGLRKIGWSLIGPGLILVGAVAWDGIDGRIPDFEELKVERGAFIRVSAGRSRIGIKRNNDGHNFLCVSRICGGFPVAGLIGRPARVWITPSAKIYQIEVDGVVHSSYESIVSGYRIQRGIGIGLLLLGAGFLTLSILTHRKVN